MKTINIFLASSAELREDREGFNSFLYAKTKSWAKKEIFLNSVMWEEFIDAVSQTRLQDEYNKAIKECDIFIMLFFTKVGKYTVEEFETAFKQFKETNKPFVYIYFKDAPVSTGSITYDIISLLDFQKKLKELGHFTTWYKNIEDLKYKFGEQLDKLYEQEFYKLDQSKTVQPFDAGEFSDKEIIKVIEHLNKLHQVEGAEFLSPGKLLPELSSLFDRKTFRFEKLRQCPEQRWADRLDSAYQTHKVLKGYMRNIQKDLPAKYSTYRNIVMEVDKYCMQMGSLLFEEVVDYNKIEEHIGKRTFKSQLPPEHKFPTEENKQPIIPDNINDMIEPHRTNAVNLMDQLVNDLS